MNRHEFKPSRLIAALIFAAVAIGAFFGPYDDHDMADWILPAVFVAIGATLVGSAVAQARRSDDQRTDGQPTGQLTHDQPGGQ